MDKNYNFQETEKRLVEWWQKEGIYRFDENSDKEIYSIDTPPPTVSGEMHIGHACSYSQADFIARYKRMKGFNVFYPFGTDDNGLPTERLVEKSRNIKSRDMPRDQFIKICLDFLSTERPKFIQDWKNIGISSDYSIFYSTIDDHSRKISQWSFLDLYKRNRLYRKDAPSMWCPECKTGVAQVEVQDKEFDSTFNDIVFKVEGKDLVIATTRPELLPACVAVFYNPSDERYKKLKGKSAKVPLFDLEVPIMEDERVSIDKGTGIVMCCTFGDQTDMEWQKAYNLPIRMAITEEGTMSDLAEKYKGLKIKAARKEIINDLKNKNLLLKQVPIKHAVNVHERCGTEIEFIKSKQWFVKYLDLKEEMIQWGKELKWYPEFMRHRYENWVNGLQWDWLISNQRYFGVPFPVWYCKKCGEVILADEKQLPIDPLNDKPNTKECLKCKSTEFIPETDILNTWFTSSMTPQLSTWLFKDNKKLFPMNLRPQAHEIISFWLFNTMVKSRLHFGKNPWKDAAISGFVTLQGEKMSKSKGNTIRPQEVLQKYGADAIRYWAASSKLGEDFDYQEKDLITGQKTVVKLWNATNFTFINMTDYDRKIRQVKGFDKWMLVKLSKAIKETSEGFEDYNYSIGKSVANQLFWATFCDNYLEIVKDKLYNPDKRGIDAKKDGQLVVYVCLRDILKLFAPIMPFIAEEIWQNFFKEKEGESSIHNSEWPELDLEDEDTEKKGDELVDILSQVRKMKNDNKKSLKTEIILTMPNLGRYVEFLEDLKAVTKAKEIKEGNFNVELME